MYAMIAMQPDIAFAVKKFSQMSHDPKVCHCVGLDKILHYLREIVDYSVIILIIKPVGFADFVYSEDSSNCRSIYGMTMILGPAVYV